MLSFKVLLASVTLLNLTAEAEACAALRKLDWTFYRDADAVVRAHISGYQFEPYPKSEAIFDFEVKEVLSGAVSRPKIQATMEMGWDQMRSWTASRDVIVPLYGRDQSFKIPHQDCGQLAVMVEDPNILNVVKKWIHGVEKYPGAPLRSR